MAATILVVDDEEGIRRTLTAMLEDEGYTVVTAVDGLDALDKLTQRLPQLILLDLSMPRMDGFAFAAALQERGLRSEIPILILTADTRALRTARQTGADGYIAKPFSLPHLLHEVDRLLAAAEPGA